MVDGWPSGGTLGTRPRWRIGRSGSRSSSTPTSRTSSRRTAIGDLTEATGGVTEGGRDRVVLPFTGVYSDNDHVLGHELVHVFQYDIAETRGPAGWGAWSAAALVHRGHGRVLLVRPQQLAHRDVDARRAAAQQVPDDQAAHQRPALLPVPLRPGALGVRRRRLGRPRGRRCLHDALRFGWDPALVRVLGVGSDSLSKLWIASIRTSTLPCCKDARRPSRSGRPCSRRASSTATSTSRRRSVPDGSFVAFFSQRGLFSIDLYLADPAPAR